MRNQTRLFQGHQKTGVPAADILKADVCFGSDHFGHQGFNPLYFGENEYFPHDLSRWCNYGIAREGVVAVAIFREDSDIGIREGFIRLDHTEEMMINLFADVPYMFPLNVPLLQTKFFDGLVIDHRDAALAVEGNQCLGDELDDGFLQAEGQLGFLKGCLTIPQGFLCPKLIFNGLGRGNSHTQGMRVCGVIKSSQSDAANQFTIGIENRRAGNGQFVKRLIVMLSPEDSDGLF